jgi:exopolysaccharide production protein ExoZ
MSKLTNIQIMRALAALSVIVYHTGIETRSVCEAIRNTCAPPFWDASYGVELFFMISGFIMIVTSWDQFGSPKSAIDFMHRRIARIVPLYWFVTTLAVVGVFFAPSMLKGQELDASYAVASYLFWPVERGNGLIRPIANLGWTLNLEMFFYVIFAVALLLGRLKGLVLATCTLLAFTVPQMLGVFAKGGAFPSVPLNFWGDPIILNFIFGMLIGVVYQRGCRHDWPTVITFALVSLIALLLNYNSYFGNLGIFPENHPLMRIVTSLPSGFLFAGAALGPQLDVRNLLIRIGMLMGDASYSLYLIHPFMLRALSKIWPKIEGTALPEWTFIPVCIMAAIASGLALYYVFERPVTQYLTNIHRTRVTSKFVSQSV